MSVDKNQSTLNFITTYPNIQTSPLFVNFINANRKYVDGSVLKRYTFSLIITKSVTNLAVAKDGMLSENIDDIADIQAFMDWINEQGENQVYPDFGENCVIEEMQTTSENPSLDGINTEVSPALALYSMEIIAK